MTVREQAREALAREDAAIAAQRERTHDLIQELYEVSVELDLAEARRERIQKQIDIMGGEPEREVA